MAATTWTAPEPNERTTARYEEVHVDLRAKFHEWTVRFGKAYDTAEEWEERLLVFASNAAYVREYNAKHTSHWLGLNGLADLTVDEFKAKYLGLDAKPRQGMLRNSNAAFRYENVDLQKLPDQVDWRKKGAVTHVKNQGMCGSCWSFSTTGSVEGINAIYTGELVALSEQELIDCDTTRDHGCHGGLMDYAFDFIIQNGGITTEADYPYTMSQGVCRNARSVVTIDGYEDVPSNDESALQKAAAHQPISVAIEADKRAFQLYSGGVFDNEDCGTALDHGVLIVGYGTTSPSESANKGSAEYWIVKNSWGSLWGEEGYVRLARNTGSPEGMCGIAMMPSYPTKDEPNPPPGPPLPPPSPPGPGPSPGPPTPPGPGPVQCANGQQCAPHSTCCCLVNFSGTCFVYGCCPYPQATCCDDHIHCCPTAHPICDTKAGKCKASSAPDALTVPIGVKSPAKRSFSRSDPMLLTEKKLNED
uniref:Granulins domain-containing protein n=1 Tax=Picocystis salinarum TaxID=88271 RepID=A0A7S3UE94_9CHLO